MESLDQEVERARGLGDDAALLSALIRRVDDRVKQGAFGLARIDLQEAATLEARAGNREGEAVAWQSTAALYRLERDFSAARRAIERAEALVTPDTPRAVAVHTERGEIEQKAGNGEGAYAAYTRALEEGVRAGLRLPNQLTLYLCRADALGQAGRDRDAALLLQEARARAEAAGEAGAAVRCRVAELTAWQRAGDLHQVRERCDAAVEAARAVGDEDALADLALLEAARALEGRDLRAAVDASRRARDHALAARNGINYLVAAVSLSKACDLTDDRVGAYEALAVGWVTLGDLVGPDLARSSFEPRLRDLAERWGREAFLEARSACEARQVRR